MMQMEKAWAVDAACSGNPGPMEYRGIDLSTGKEVFHFGPIQGTNNIGEFLAIVHAISLLNRTNRSNYTIYTDSVSALAWIRNKKCKTTLKRTPETEYLFKMIDRAEWLLHNFHYRNPIVKWDTKSLGEIPADFGRK